MAVGDGKPEIVQGALRSGPDRRTGMGQGGLGERVRKVPRAPKG